MNIEILTARILERMSGINKFRKDFMIHFFLLLMSIRGRYNFINFSRQGNKSEITYRRWADKPFDYLEFNRNLLQTELPADEYIIAYDHSFIKKSGKKTPGIGYFWSGCASRVERGIEIGSFAAVGINSKTAFHLIADQTIREDQKEKESCLDYYGAIVHNYATQLKSISSILVVDSFFPKKPFIEKVLSDGFSLVSKLASNAKLLYPYLGKRTGKRGRPKKYDGKVDLLNPRENHFRHFLTNEGYDAYEGQVYLNNFKMKLSKCVVVHVPNKKGEISVQIFFSTDENTSAENVLKYYSLRFQIEFTYRDAKQFTGLSHSQARNKQRFHEHINASLTTVNLAKALHLSEQPKSGEKKPFSMASYKIEAANKLITDIIFMHLEINPKLKENKQLMETIYKIGSIAA